MEEEDAEFVEEFLSAADPSILHFLLASGEEARAPLSLALLLMLFWQGSERELEEGLSPGCRCRLGRFSKCGQDCSDGLFTSCTRVTAWAEARDRTCVLEHWDAT